MNFGIITTGPCVNTVPPPDSRCSDPAFALANPGLCPAVPSLIIKPSVAITCAMGSVQFRTFIVNNGAEQDVTDQTTFASSDLGVVLVGASSGNATGMMAGQTTVIATYQGLTASANMSVLAGDSCCNNQHVAMLLLVDQTKSMSQSFGGAYPTKLAFAKAAATRFVSELNVTKDEVGIMAFHSNQSEVVAGISSDVSDITAAIPNIIQTSDTTEFYDAISAAIDQLNGASADERVLVLISDGNDTMTSAFTQANDPLVLLSNFKAAGGIVICLGVRAAGVGFSFLEAMATGGFFLNAFPANAAASLNYLSGLKGYICAGNCTPAGDIMVAQGALNYDNFINWNLVGGGTVDLHGNGFFDLLPGNGLYVDLLSGNTPTMPNPQMVLKTPISLTGGHAYRLTVDLAGNNEIPQPGIVEISVYTTGQVLLDQQIVIADYRQGFQPYAFNFTATNDEEVYVSIQQINPTGDLRFGILLDNVKFDDVTDVNTLFEDTFDSENRVYLPPACGTGTYPHLYLTPYSVPYYNGILKISALPAGGMTSNTTPSGTVTSTNTLPDNDPSSDFMCFSKLDSGDDYYTSIAFSTYTYPWVDPWIQYTFPTAQTLISYTIHPVMNPRAGGDGSYLGTPSSWLFQGSNDGGTTWTTLDTQSNVQLNETPGGKEFLIAAPASFTAYRFFLSIAQGKVLSFDNVPTQLEALAQLAQYGVDQWWYIILGPVDFFINGTVGTGFSTGYNTNTSYVSSYYGCYGSGCLSQPPGVQQADPAPQSDIELGGSGPVTTYVSVQSATATCPDSPTVSVTKTSTQTSTVSQSDADTKAYNDALAQANAALVCPVVYKSTQSATVSCPFGSFGNRQTATASATSQASQAAADTTASNAALAAAQALLDCTLSNNTQPIIDSSGAIGPFAPFPSVKFIAGLTGVITNLTCTLKNISHCWFSDIAMILMAPDGTWIGLMYNTGHDAFNPPGISHVTLTWDDAAPGQLPWGAALPTGGTDAAPTPASYQPQNDATTYGNIAILNSFPGFPTVNFSKRITTLSGFNGKNPNGAWALCIVDISPFDSGTIAGGFDVNITSA